MASNNTITRKAESEEGIDLSRIVANILTYWHLYLICLGLSLGLSYYYVKYTHPVYEMSATILVRDDKSATSETLLMEMGLLNTKRNIENEIEILTSRSLLLKALRSLNLNVTYARVEGLLVKEIYLSNPIILDYALAEEPPRQFYMTVTGINDSLEVVTDYVNSTKDEIEIHGRYALGQAFENEIGHFRLVENNSSADVRKLNHGETLQIHYRNDELMVNSYRADFKVETVRAGSSILMATLEEKVRSRGIAVLNKIMEVYEQSSVEEKNQLAANSLRFIDAQISTISKDLSEIESEIERFKMSNGISDISSEANYYLGRLEQHDGRLTEIDIQLSFISNLENYLVTNKNLHNASPSSLGISDPLLQDLIQRITMLEEEREGLLGFTKSDNPLIASLEGKIQLTRQALNENIKNVRSGLEASRKAAIEKVSGIEAEVRGLPSKEYELLAYQRQFSIKEQIYLVLLQKQSENSIMLASTVANNTILDRAIGAPDPVSPIIPLAFGLALFIGFALPSMLIALFGLLDNTIKEKSDVTEITGLPLVGFIPINDDKNRMAVISNPSSVVSEAFRNVRTNLQFVLKTRPADDQVLQNVIMLTSSVGSEGKSFCSLNLASILALGGERVVVVGLDLRKPKLGAYFGLKEEQGVSTVLGGIDKLEDVIVHTEHPNLDIMLAGPIPPNPGEMIMTEGMFQLLRYLADRYDKVILDTPPVGIVADGIILGKYVASTIYVVRHKFTYRSQLENLNEMVTEGRLRNVSVLLNAVKQSRIGYGGYGYGYGIGYGYGNYAKKEKRGVLAKFFKRS